jgi:hypothetical protein
MTPKDFADIASALAWPLTAIAFLAVFFKQVRALLERLAETLTIKNIKLRIFLTEIELTPELVKRVFDELLDEIAQPTNRLEPEESSLFDRILRAGGRETINDVFPGFQRNSREHEQLRKLRYLNLVRPLEGGQWRGEKHPIPTRFGELVYELKSAPKS